MGISRYIPRGRSLRQWTVFGALALGLALGGAWTTPNQETVASDWPQFHYNLKRTGYNPTETRLSVSNVNQLVNTWSFQAGAGIGSSPTVVGNAVYFGSSDGKVYALNATTGVQLWAYQTGGQVYPTPAVVAGRLFVGSQDHYVYSLNASTGAVIWQYLAGPPEENITFQSSPLVSTQNATLYIGVSSQGDNPLIAGRLLALNAANGALRWQYNVMPQGQVGGGIWGPPSLDPAAGLVFFTTGNPDNAIIAVDWNTGAQRWKFQPFTDPNLDLDFGVAPTVYRDANGRNRVAAGGKNGVMYCLDELTGALIWQFTASPEGNGIRSSAAFDPNTGYLVFGSAGDTLITSGHVYALNALTGTQVWRVDTPAEVVSSPAVANGVAYVAYGTSSIGRTGAVLALNERTGSELWRFDGNTAVWSSPTVTRGQFWIGGINSRMYHFALPGLENER